MQKEQNEVCKKERLISRFEAAESLGLSYRSFVKIKPLLIANGLQEVIVVNSKKYREASINRVIARVAEKGIPLKVKK